MDEAAKARRQALGIPVHETESDHHFVDGYCTCGAVQPSRKQGKRKYLSERAGSTSGKSNLDIIEENQDNR